MEVLTDQNSKDYCVLKFTAETGRYYSNFKSETLKIQNT